MENYWAIPVLVSILILGTLGISQSAFAVDVVISDESSCLLQGGSWDTDTCTITNFSNSDDDTFGMVGVTVIFDGNSQISGEVDVQDGSLIINGEAFSDAFIVVDPPGVLTINADFTNDGDLAIGDNGGGTIDNYGILTNTDSGAITIEVGFFNNFGTINNEGGSMEIFAANPEVNPTPDPGVFNNFGTLNNDLFEGNIRNAGIINNFGVINNIDADPFFGGIFNEGIINNECDGIITGPPIINEGAGIINENCAPSEQTPEEQTQNVIAELDEIVDNTTDPQLAEKVEDASITLQIAIDELNKDTPDTPAAMGNIEGAIGDLEAAINDGLDPLVGAELMDELAGIARQLAVDAIDEAVAAGGDSDKIATANEKLGEGDDFRDNEGKFKDAASKYKDALSEAESALP